MARSERTLRAAAVAAAFFGAVSGVAVGLLLPGCGSGGQSPAAIGMAAPSPPRVPAANAPRLADIGTLDVTRGGTFQVRAPKRSLAVVQHFDAELTGRGWRKLAPSGADQPGRREWLDTGAPVGPTDSFDAAWTDPGTGRTAVLSLWHTAKDPDVQRGTFEILTKGAAPS